VVTFTHRLLYPCRKSPQNPEACIYVLEKRKISSVTSSHYFIYITTSLTINYKPPNTFCKTIPLLPISLCVKKKKR